MTSKKRDSHKPAEADPATLKFRAGVILGFLAIFIAAGAIVFGSRACGGDEPAPMGQGGRPVMSTPAADGQASAAAVLIIKG